MKTGEVKKALIDLIKKEIEEGSQFIGKESLIRMKEALIINDTLGEKDCQDLANYVVGQYIGEGQGYQYEEVIDWLLYKTNKINP